MIYQKFKNTLSDKGLKTVEVNVGDEFNVDFHEAITSIPAPSEELKGKIVDVVETGYQLHDRVIRFAKSSYRKLIFSLDAGSQKLDELIPLKNNFKHPSSII